MGRVGRTDGAEADLVDILVYLREANPGFADRFERDFEEKCQLLSQFPAIGRSREELGEGLRSTLIGRYIIFFRTVEEGVEILRILHGSRDLPRFFG